MDGMVACDVRGTVENGDVRRAGCIWMYVCSTEYVFMYVK
jgi:hypothetical protein